jgi:RNA ligase (TIGR02306 family)
MESTPVIADFSEGDDVTSLLKIEKYEPPETGCNLSGEAKGTFPSFLIKTDEERIQNIPNILEEEQGESIYVTEKIDGTSFTCYYHMGVFGVCSRNMELKETEGNIYWKMARKYQLEEKMKIYEQSLAIQGEVHGPGIQGNKYKLEEVQLRVFSMYDICEDKYLSLEDMEKICEGFELEMVPVLSRDIPLTGTVDSWIELVSNLMSRLNPAVKAEGYVVRGLNRQYWSEGKFSFKVINPEFLLEHGE